MTGTSAPVPCEYLLDTWENMGTFASRMRYERNATRSIWNRGTAPWPPAAYPVQHGQTGCDSSLVPFVPPDSRPAPGIGVWHRLCHSYVPHGSCAEQGYRRQSASGNGKAGPLCAHTPCWPWGGTARPDGCGAHRVSTATSGAQHHRAHAAALGAGIGTGLGAAIGAAVKVHP